MGLPALGSIRFNSSTISSVNSLAIRAVNQDGQDVSDYIISQTGSTSVINSYMVVQSNVNGDSTYAIFTIGSVTDNSTWLEVGATYVAGTMPENNEVLSVSFYRVGDVGPTGPATSIDVSSTTGLPGSEAEVSVTGPAGDQTISFIIPQGPTGPSNTLTVGTVSSTGPDNDPAVTITGTSPDQTINFVLKQGPTGAQGPTGPLDLPSYTGNAGKYLTTNGTDVLWATVDALPSQTDNAGKYLFTNGTVLCRFVC
jgi:hypothetical protein